MTMNAEVTAVLREMLAALRILGEQLDQRMNMLGRIADTVKETKAARKTKRAT